MNEPITVKTPTQTGDSTDQNVSNPVPCDLQSSDSSTKPHYLYTTRGCFTKILSQS